MSWSSVCPDDLAALVAGRLRSVPGVVRVAIDGAPCAHPERLADALVEALRMLGRPAVHVRAETFWRDASLRLEYGREDVESFSSWLDAAALRREVLDAARERREYLPSLRDPQTNRSTREPPQPVDADVLVIVSGALLLRHALPFDVTVHLFMSAAARARRLEPALAWTLPAYAEYDAAATPSEVADIVVRMDDPRHPAARGLTS